MTYRPWLMWVVVALIVALALFGLYVLATGRVTMFDCGFGQKFCVH
ncbi:MAG TPA: hypothetical protein VF506_17985 [Streptosporangiaceae bacterium]